MIAGGRSYYVELQGSENFQFQLRTATLLSNPTDEAPASYNFNTLLLDIPSVFAFGKNYKVQMKNNGSFFIITGVTDN